MEIYLRALEIKDFSLTSTWRNDPEVTDLLAGNVFHTSPDREKKWIEEVIMNDKVNIRLGVALKENDKLIGMVNLINIQWIDRNAEFSILLGDKSEWGKGYGKQATAQMLNFGFRERNLERIYLTVDVDHNRAISIYEDLGFKKEGVLRKHHFRKGKYRDVFIYSILKDEYV
ncbi:GNAT family N-acetyltransferase [Salinimicrobium sp. HB62]|uniref:GNAT family N-acetyltransferase n=1 Tax=Salinimicrobium sp. HB62 TaxID=3077781 RepID=UPI002D77B58E|nr:GNAT family protein [Salinimicrobium sp. HB62]